MPPRSPLPLRHGLSAAWVCTPHRDPERPAPWTSMGEWLRHHVDARVDVEPMLAAGRFVYADARPVGDADPYRPHTFVWFHRDLRDEPTVPGELVVVHRDERVVVVDKPAFLSTVPRGRHVTQSLVVRLRDELGLPELTPMHRLDRVTSGLVLCAVGKQWRASYQSLFAQGRVRKTYRALAPWRADLEAPRTVRDHIAPIPGTGRAEVVPGAPINAETLVELEERRGDLAVYRLTPRTGRTHQLRLHLRDLGVPIVDDPLYPVDLAVDVDDFSRPLQLLASELEYVDPVDGVVRRFVSPRSLPLGRATPTTIFVSRRSHEQDLRPGYVYREDPDNERDSGWRALVGDETAAEADDPRSILLLDLEGFVARWPELRPLVGSSPPDGEWTWDGDHGRYAPRPSDEG